MIAERQPRRVEREKFTDVSRLILAENDLDQNDREHARMYKDFNAKVDRLTKAAVTLALTFAGSALALIFNLLQDKL